MYPVANFEGIHQSPPTAKTTKSQILVPNFTKTKLNVARGAVVYEIPCRT